MTTKAQKQIILKLVKFYKLTHKIDEEGYLEVDHKCTQRGAWHVYFNWNERYEDFSDFLNEVSTYFYDVGKETNRGYY